MHRSSGYWMCVKVNAWHHNSSFSFIERINWSSLTLSLSSDADHWVRQRKTGSVNENPFWCHYFGNWFVWISAHFHIYSSSLYLIRYGSYNAITSFRFRFFTFIFGIQTECDLQRLVIHSATAAVVVSVPLSLSVNSGITPLAYGGSRFVFTKNIPCDLQWNRHPKMR